MIDSTSETVISLAQAADELPRRRRGRKTHVSTLYRWATAGCRGVVLESIQIGATRCTSPERRCSGSLSGSRLPSRPGPSAEASPDPGPVVGRRTLAQRQRASAEAGRKLAELGA